MRLILLGAPGAGKGTQAKLLCDHFDIPAISTGNMLREAMANGSELGKQVKSYMETGRLVSDDLVLELLNERLNQPDCKNGYILDGVPRTLVQAQTMDAKGIAVDYVVSIEVDDKVIEERMTGRRVCGKCGASYHLTNNPPKQEGICDGCGENLTIRSDDAPETVRGRLKIYHETTEVLKDYYQKQGKVCLVEGNQPIEDAFYEILRALGETK